MHTWSNQGFPEPDITGVKMRMQKLVFLLSGLYRNLNAIPEILMYFVLITQAKMKLMTPDIIYIQIYIGIGILTANNFCG